MTFSPGTLQSNRTAIQNLMGIQVVPKFEKYLGMPAVVGRSKKEVFSFLKDRVWDRVKKWNVREFSMAGREILIKAVLQAIPSYVMSCFLLPSSLIQDIEQIIRKFWWSGGESRGMHWLSWSKMCRAKDSGGMGFRDLECFNLAMLAKQAWRPVTDPDSLLSRILKARYYPRGTYFTADVGERPSHTWRGILAARNGLSQGLRKRIGNGLDTAIWGDFWLPPRSSSRIMTRRPPDCVFPDKVSDLIDWSTWSWDFELISNTFWEVDVHNILQLSFGSPTTEDKLF